MKKIKIKTLEGIGNRRKNKRKSELDIEWIFFKNKKEQEKYMKENNIEIEEPTAEFYEPLREWQK